MTNQWQSLIKQKLRKIMLAARVPYPCVSLWWGQWRQESNISRRRINWMPRTNQWGEEHWEYTHSRPYILCTLEEVHVVLFTVSRRWWLAPRVFGAQMNQLEEPIPHMWHMEQQRSLEIWESERGAERSNIYYNDNKEWKKNNNFMFNVLSLRIANGMQKTHTAGGLNISWGLKTILVASDFAAVEISDVKCSMQFSMLLGCSNVYLDLGGL